MAAEQGPQAGATETVVTKMATHPQIPKTQVAVATGDGVRVNTPLGEADYLLIYDVSSSPAKVVGLRKIPPYTAQSDRWTTIASLVRDCPLLLTGGIAPEPKALLQRNGTEVRTVRGRIDDLLAKIDAILLADDEVPFVCDESCHGGRRGCRCEMA
jgi:nitrogen fixation protein NifB